MCARYYLLFVLFLTLKIIIDMGGAMIIIWLSADPGVCGYCGFRNSANAWVCKSCGNRLA